METRDERLRVFEEERPRLFALAYRMLGAASEADDVLQEAWVRWQTTEGDDVRTPAAFLSTVVTRLSLDQLARARTRREHYDGTWLPEPVMTRAPPDAESISLAFLALLEKLTPLERAAYLLREVFAYSHAEVAVILERDEAACRQLHHRAREHLQRERPRFAPSREAHLRILEAFSRAVQAGDLAGLERLLARDATLWGDGGGKVHAVQGPVHGASRIAQFFARLARAPGGLGGFAFEVQEVNGWPALVMRRHGQLYGAVTLETDGNQVNGVRSVLNPDKLGALRQALGQGGQPIAGAPDNS